MSSKKGKNPQRIPEALVSGAALTSLVLIGLLAILELGPPQIMIYTGASPFNTGLLGASDLYAETKALYPRTIVITNWSRGYNMITGCSIAVLVVISPEIPYTVSDASSIWEALSQCQRRGFVVADESGNANNLLNYIGSYVRVDATRVLDIQTRLPYPVAVFNTSWGYGGELVLDIASSLSIAGGSDHEVILSGAVPSAYIANQSGSLPGRIYLDVAIAYEERFGNTSIFVVGDGSIFLNQVLRSQYRDRYLSLYKGILDHMCGMDMECLVIFDGSRYIGGDPVSIIERGINPSLLVTPEFIAAAIARIIHPATWLPPAISWADSFISRLVSISNLSRVLVISTSVLIVSLLLLSRAPPRRIDSPIDAGRDVGDMVAMGRANRSVGVGRRVFIELYRAIDESIYREAGVRLSDTGCAEKLADRGVDIDLARMFCTYMNRMARRAMLRSIYPPIVRWGRAIERALELYSRIM